MYCAARYVAPALEAGESAIGCVLPRREPHLMVVEKMDLSRIMEPMGPIILGRITVLRIEGGAQCPTFPTLERLARALGMTVCDLIVPVAHVSRLLDQLPRGRRQPRRRREPRAGALLAAAPKGQSKEEGPAPGPGTLPGAAGGASRRRGGTLARRGLASS